MSDIYYPLKQESGYFLGGLKQAQALNNRLATEFDQAKHASPVRQTHFFHGRFENTYIDKADVPALQAVLDMTTHYAGQILDKPVSALRMGFWFNEMLPGQQTSLHTHEEDGELLSAVYYICADELSGDLVVHVNGEPVHLTPQPGRLVLFRPHVPHHVDINKSDILRLSVAINIGH